MMDSRESECCTTPPCHFGSTFGGRPKFPPAESWGFFTLPVISPLRLSRSCGRDVVEKSQINGRFLDFAIWALPGMTKKIVLQQTRKREPIFPTKLENTKNLTFKLFAASSFKTPFLLPF